MCTASWFFSTDHYYVFFNRDELKSRSIALPPSAQSCNSLQALMPIDPDGGGTWIGVNDAGWTFALLNYYQGDTPAGPLISRGGIVRSMLACASQQQLNNQLQSLNLQRYAPFSLLSFAPVQLAATAKPPEQNEATNSVLMWQWNGRQLSRRSCTRVMSSSSKLAHGVLAARRDAASHFNVLPQHAAGTEPANDASSQHLIERHRQLHSSHLPDQSAFAVCMHRSDAGTVSYSEISVTAQQSRFDYYAGSPCRRGSPATTILAR